VNYGKLFTFFSGAKEDNFDRIRLEDHMPTENCIRINISNCVGHVTQNVEIARQALAI
jgi:hypothetical protein